MLPSISTPLIPSEIYFLFFVVTFATLIKIIINTLKDTKYVQNSNVIFYNISTYLLLTISFLCLLCLFLPIVEIPLFGGISVIEMTNKLDDDMLYITPLIVMYILLFIFSVIVSIKKISFKGSKSRIWIIVFSFLVLLIDIFIYIEINSRIHPKIDNDNFIINAISSGFKIGIGMYLLIILTVIYLLISFFSFGNNKIVKNQSKLAIEIRELKQLLDEGIITKEEFENQKEILLNKKI